MKFLRFLSFATLLSAFELTAHAGLGLIRTAGQYHFYDNDSSISVSAISQAGAGVRPSAPGTNQTPPVVAPK